MYDVVAERLAFRRLLSDPPFAVTIEGDKRELPVPTAPDARGDPEDEATTVWGKADLFEGVETEEEEEDDLFGAAAERAELAPGISNEPITGPIRLEDAPLGEDPEDEDTGEEAEAATVQMTAAEAAAMATASQPANVPPPGQEAPPPTAPGDLHHADGGEISQARAAADRPYDDAPLVELSGDEREAAEREAQARQDELEADPTRVVTLGEALTDDCRMCGKKVTAPRPRRFRGSTKAVTGFRCDRCGNVFCAAHVVRVSSLWSSLLGRGRFRCQLCNLDS